MLRIVTDGAADMPVEWYEKFKINLLPLRIRFGETTYIQGVDVTPDNFYKLVKEKKAIPKSSLPSPLQVVEFYRKIAQKGDQILSIHIASKMSGTFSTVEMAARELAGELDIHPFDSGAGSAALGFMCREARILEERGLSLQEILKNLERMKQRLAVVFTVDNLEFARMSGRINGIQAAISSLLKIKPIIVLKDGLLGMAEKVRTRQKALDRILDDVKAQVGEQKVFLAVVHAADPATARDLIEQAKKKFRIVDSFVEDLSIPVAANLGPGTIGIVAIPVEE